MGGEEELGKREQAGQQSWAKEGEAELDDGATGREVGAGDGKGRGAWVVARGEELSVY